MRRMAELEMPIRSYSEDRFRWWKFFRDWFFFSVAFGVPMLLADAAIFSLGRHSWGRVIRWDIPGFAVYGLIMAAFVRPLYSCYARLYQDRIVGNAGWKRLEFSRKSVRSVREISFGVLWDSQRGLAISEWRPALLARLFGFIFVPSTTPDYDQWKSDLADSPGMIASNGEK